MNSRASTGRSRPRRTRRTGRSRRPAPTGTTQARRHGSDDGPEGLVTSIEPTRRRDPGPPSQQEKPDRLEASTVSVDQNGNDRPESRSWSCGRSSAVDGVPEPQRHHQVERLGGDDHDRGQASSRPKRNRSRANAESSTAPDRSRPAGAAGCRRAPEAGSSPASRGPSLPGRFGPASPRATATPDGPQRRRRRPRNARGVEGRSGATHFAPAWSPPTSGHSCRPGPGPSHRPGPGPVRLGRLTPWTAADDRFDPATYGRSFADVCDAWYPADEVTGATVAHVAALAGPGGSVLELGSAPVAGAAAGRAPVGDRSGRVSDMLDPRRQGSRRSRAGGPG